jgi:hypothetical protein
MTNLYFSMVEHIMTKLLKKFHIFLMLQELVMK